MKNKKQKSLFCLPEWVPYDAWCGYIEMRLKIRKPMTEYAVGLAIDKLWKLQQTGHNPKEVLEQSILNSWQGLFPVAGDGNGQTSKADRRSAQISEATRRIFEEDECFSGHTAAGIPLEDGRRGNQDLEGDVKELFLSGVRESNKRVN